MIDAKELRIGNWIYSEDTKEPYQLNAFGIITVERSPENRSPISLTTEILENIGLKHGKTGKKKDDSFVEFWDIKTPFIHKHSFGSFYFSIVRWWQDNKPLEFTFSHHEIRVDCKYVHQLQNLFYALTGTELEINL